MDATCSGRYDGSDGTGLGRLMAAAADRGLVFDRHPDRRFDPRQHPHVTPVHEAGHAVAYTLAGRDVLDVRVFRGSPLCRWHRGRQLLLYGQTRLRPPQVPPGQMDVLDRLLWCLKDVVATFAGPAAEVRIGGGQGGDGADVDFSIISELSRMMGPDGPQDLYAIERWAWGEACRLMADAQVWRCVQEVAARVSQSADDPRTTSGGFVRRVVQRHMAGGWPWTAAADMAAQLMDLPRISHDEGQGAHARQTFAP